MAIEMTGGKIVEERGTVVTFRQKCEGCGYVFDFNKTTIVPAFSSRKVPPVHLARVRQPPGGRGSLSLQRSAPRAQLSSRLPFWWASTVSLSSL